MEERPKLETSSVLENAHCKDCGWPVIDACCNDEFQDFKNAEQWDWWQYCSNKGCKNHEGEGIFQARVDWIDYHEPEQKPFPPVPKPRQFTCPECGSHFYERCGESKNRCTGVQLPDHNKVECDFSWWTTKNNDYFKTIEEM